MRERLWQWLRMKVWKLRGLMLPRGTPRGRPPYGGRCSDMHLRIRLGQNPNYDGPGD